MKVYVLWGFLGSGKTTLINHLLLTHLKDKNVVIIENESGKESIDGIELQTLFRCGFKIRMCLLYASFKAGRGIGRNQAVTQAGLGINGTFRLGIAGRFVADSQSLYRWCYYFAGCKDV